MLTTAGIEDMLYHFFLKWRPWYRDGRTWIMIWAGREVRSRTGYILGIDHCLFRNLTVRDPQNNSNHYLVLGCLRGAPLREHTKYLGRGKCPPPMPPHHPDKVGQTLRGPREVHPKA